MKVTQYYTRNNESTITGYSITITAVYSSFNKEEIDKLQEILPEGVVTMDVDASRIFYNDDNRKE